MADPGQAASTLSRAERAEREAAAAQNEGWFTCERCGCHYTTRDFLMRHIEVAHVRPPRLRPRRAPAARVAIPPRRPVQIYIQYRPTAATPRQLRRITAAPSRQPDAQPRRVEAEHAYHCESGPVRTNNECRRPFPTQEALDEHRAKRHDPTPCPICDKNFFGSAGVSVHRSRTECKANARAERADAPSRPSRESGEDLAARPQPAGPPARINLARDTHMQAAHALIELFRVTPLTALACV